MKKMTMTEIARKAGVSQPVVSSVINNSSTNRPSEKTRQKILEIIKKYNFVPDLRAQNLKKGKTDTIAVTTGGPNLVQVFHHPYMSRLYTGMAAALENTDLRLQFCHFKQIVGADDALRMATNSYADGILYILLSVYLKQFKKDGIVEEYNRLGIPYVVIHSMNRDLGCHAVTMDGCAGAEKAVDHLIEHGYGSIGFAGVQKGATVHVDDMFRGYKRSLEKHGMSVPEKYVYRSASFVPGSQAEMMKKIVTAKSKPRALFVALSSFTPHLIKRLTQAGISVPDDMAVIGFDDPAEAGLFDPAITYLEQPSIAKGKAAAGLLLELINANGNKKRPHTVTLAPQLVMGGTCGC